MSTTTDVKEYTQKAVAFRADGHLDEAELVAKKAIDLDPDDANAWWQLALTLSAKNDLVPAIRAFEKVTELASHFADGWCELGLAHKKVARLDKAISYFESALNVDAEHVRSLRLLNIALTEREGKTDSPKRLELLRALQRLDALHAEEHFALAFLLAEHREFLEAAKAYESYTKQYANSAAYYNLGLICRNLGRDADAIDAYRIALEMDSADAATQNNIKTLLPKLLALREKVLAQGQPYLKQTDWYKHYINPFALLNVDNALELYENPKALQKAKQALFREIDLEDGKVEWMPGLNIDKSSAMAILEPLNDAVQWDVHQAVLENNSLCEFLMRGHLSHFLAVENPLDKAAMPHMVEGPVLEVVSSSFARQYDAVLTKAIERGDAEVVECLFDGRRWVLPEDEERCIEGARRAVDRLCEPLRNLAESSERQKVSLTEIESSLAKGSLHSIAKHLPAEFYENHATICGLLRDLSVNVYNREGDAATAKAISSLSRESASKSPALTHQLGEDEKVLDRKIAEEKKNEAHLTFGKNGLDITKAGVTYGDKMIAAADIVAVRWGMVLTDNAPRKVRFRIAFNDGFGTEIDVSWTSQAIEEQQKLWGSLVDATLHYLIDSIAANFKRRLKIGTPIHVGKLEVRESGVVFEVNGWFSQKKVICPWTNLLSEIHNGDVVLRDATNSKATATLSLDSTDNAIVLHLLAKKKGL
ncbi:tetratricopeptide repeat protein [Paraburkholderia dipogonis]|uniref:Tetratricopeptide repeat protein n=1 Tax=Paraburkholderia dipogonis TaxID=1211383 RepID=A0ABW9APT7_9BURK